MDRGGSEMSQDVPIWEIERDEAGRAARMVLVGYEPQKGSTGRVGPQEGGFTPAERQLNLALGKRETKAQRILARLRIAPATTLEMLKVGGIRYGARIHELREQGYQIDREDCHHDGHEWSVYTLRGE